MAYWVLPAFLVSLGAGPAQLGLIEGIAESVASFAKLFSGFLTDRISRRKPLVVAGYVGANAVKPLLALAGAWWQILLIRFTDRLAKGQSTFMVEMIETANILNHATSRSLVLLVSYAGRSILLSPSIGF